MKRKKKKNEKSWETIMEENPKNPIYKSLEFQSENWGERRLFKEV